MQKEKQKQIEVALSRLGAKASLARDEILRAEKGAAAAARTLGEVQQEIERLYLTLDEPFGMPDSEQ